jgi:hypothetical protein
MHFGGPMGLAGLALLAGAAGIVIYDGTQNGNNATPTSVSGEPGTSTQIPTDADPDPRPDIDVPIVPKPPIGEPEDPETPPETPVADRPIMDKPTEVTPRPAPVKPQTAPPEKPMKPAALERAEATFIVRIKGAPEIDEAARLFRKDRAAAEKAFEKYQAETPSLKGLRLVGASYSGELKLAYDFEPGVSPTRAEVRKVQKRIMAVDGVAYADPDYIAHPGQKD